MHASTGSCPANTTMSRAVGRRVAHTPVRRFTLLMASACAVALAGAAHAGTFVNGSFETGDLTGWTTGGGYWYGGAYPTANDYLPGGANYDPSGQAITVTNPGLDPYTDNNVNAVYKGNHSVQVNDPLNNYSVSVISQRVNNYTDSQIAFAYAAVLQSSHGPTDSDAFIITLTDATTNTTLFSFNLNSATAPGSFTQSSQNWYYTNWVTQTIDVSALSGHDFILSLLANDCPYGGHAGYAYLDGFGSQTGGGGTGGGSAFYWDGDATGNANNNVVNGGNGVWDAVKTNWTGADGATNGAYSPQPGSVIFAGAPGTVTVDQSAGAISVSGMQFAVDGYVIQGDPISLSSGAATIQVGDGTAAGAGYTATIIAPLSGTGELMKTDLGTLILNGVNDYSGGTAIGGGTLIGSATSFGAGAILDNAALIIDQPTDATFANEIDGMGTFDKRGAGTLELTGTSNFSGATSVDAGQLQVNGWLGNSVVTVGNGAVLGGTGVVGGVAALSGSTVAPGATPGLSIGTLNVVGDYSQAAASTYQVQALTTGGSDRILVGGAASLDSGAVLQLAKADAGHFLLGTRYTVLSAQNGVGGTFTLTGDTHVSAFVDVVADYDATNAYLDVKQTHSFASAGETPNQTAAGGGADIGHGPLFTALVYLPTFDVARAAFDQISGEIHATGDTAALEDSRFIREAVFDRLRGDGVSDDGGRAMWGRAFGSWARIDSDGNAATMHRDIGGVFVGGDVARGKSWKLGLVGGFSHSHVSVHDRTSVANTDDYHIGLYAGTQRGPAGLRLGASYTRRDVSTDRTVTFPGFSDRLGAGYGVDIVQAFGEVGYRLGTAKANLEPFGNVAAVDIMGAPINEQGGPAAVRGATSDTAVVFSTLGVRASTLINDGGTNPVRLYGSAGWRHAAGDVTPTARLSFTDGGLYTVAGLPIARDAVALEAGLKIKVQGRTDFSIAYSGQIGDQLADHGAKATITVRF